MIYKLLLNKESVYKAIETYFKDFKINDADILQNGYTMTAQGKLNGIETNIIINLKSTEVYIIRDKEICSMTTKAFYPVCPDTEFQMLYKEIYK